VYIDRMHIVLAYPLNLRLDREFIYKKEKQFASSSDISI